MVKARAKPARKTKTSAAISVDLIQDSLGSVQLPSGSLQDFIDALASPATNVMRLRREVDPQELPMSNESIPWYELGRRSTDSDVRPSRCLAYATGDYFIQDAGSLLALAAAGADLGDLPGLGGKLICDLCAAPGGKASALLEAIGDSGFVLANEPIRSRVAPLQYNLARTGSDRFAISCQDPDDLAQRLSGTFDLVLVDAPCSGQAMVARGKQKVSSLSAKQIAHSAARQNRILDAAIQLLRPGGQLVYSTCTFAEAENEQQCQRLVESNQVTATPVARLDAWQTQQGCYRLWPHLHGCAGSFAAAMQVVEGGQALDRFHRVDPDRERLSVDLKQWYDLDEIDELRFLMKDSVVLSWPKDVPDWVKAVAVTGSELAHRAGQTWKPAHAGALRRLPRGQASQSIELDADSARQFLRGEPIQCSSTGWCVVRWQGRPLGWVKANGTVGKNHLPTAARSHGELSV